MKKITALILTLAPCIVDAGGKKGDLPAHIRMQQMQNPTKDGRSLQLTLRLIKRDLAAAPAAMPLYINPNDTNSVLRLLILLNRAHALPESEEKTTLLASIVSLLQTIPTPTKDLITSLIRTIGENTHNQAVSPIVGKDDGEDDYVLVPDTGNPSRPESPVDIEEPRSIYDLSQSIVPSIEEEEESVMHEGE